MLTLGLKPYSPAICAGIRTLPPISVPQPKREPCSAMSALSPPVDPPGVNLGLSGWVVKPCVDGQQDCAGFLLKHWDNTPHSGFSVSHHMILCGKFVFAINTTPAPFNIVTTSASSVAGLNARPMYPRVES